MAIASRSLFRVSMAGRRATIRSPALFYNSAGANSIDPNELKDILLWYIVYKHCAEFQGKILIRSRVIIN